MSDRSPPIEISGASSRPVRPAPRIPVLGSFVPHVATALLLTSRGSPNQCAPAETVAD